MRKCWKILKFNKRWGLNNSLAAIFFSNLINGEFFCTIIRGIWVEQLPIINKRCHLLLETWEYLYLDHIPNRVLKWSRVSRETRLKIGLAISRDLKCKTCKTQKLAKIMHLGRFREGNKAIPHLAGFLWQPKNYVGWKSCYVSHSITCPHSPTLKLPSCVANL